jgi:putative transcriptional regulator
MESLKGHLLISSPRLLDPNFIQSVVLMVQHDTNGALGLVLNRPTEMTLKQAWEQVSQSPCERDDSLYVGGPCEGVLMAIHPFESAGQIEILPGLYFATETQHIEWLLQQTQEKRMRFFVGYSGWSPGQLEGELESGSWITANATLERVFLPDETIWRQVKREISLEQIMGKLNPRLIPNDPSLN